MKKPPKEEGLPQTDVPQATVAEKAILAGISMDNNDRLRTIFSEALGIDKDRVVDQLEYNTIPEWDSVAHMALVAAIDEGFEIMLDTDDVIDMSSFSTARDILKKYDVEF